MENTAKSPSKIVALSVAALVFLTSGAFYAESTFVAPTASTTHSGDTRLAPLLSTEKDTTITGGGGTGVSPVSTDDSDSIAVGSEPSTVSGLFPVTTKKTTTTRSVTSKTFTTPDFVSVSPVTKSSSVSSVPSPLRNAGIASVGVKPGPADVKTVEETPELNEAPKAPAEEEAPKEPVLNEAPKEPTLELNEPPREPVLNEPPVEEEAPVEEAPKEEVSEEAPYFAINFSDTTSPEVKAAWAGDFSQIEGFAGDPASSISTVVVDEDTRIIKWGAGNYKAEAELSSHDIDAFQSQYTEFINKVLTEMKNRPALNEAPKEQEPVLNEPPVEEEAPVEEAPNEQVSEEAPYFAINFSDTTSPEVRAAWAGDFSQIAKFEGDPASSISTVVVDENTRIIKWGAGDYTAEAEISSNDIDKFQSDYTEFLNKVLAHMA